MNKSKFVHSMVIVTTAMLGGCSQPAQIGPTEPAVITAADKARVMEVADDVLTRMNFVIEKFDVDRGYIKTRPLRGGQSFEFWRTDNASPEDAAEANIHSIQRTAWLDIVQNGPDVRMECDVQIRRLSMVETKMIGLSQAANLYTTRSGALRSLEPQADEFTWIDLGPDPALEQKILRKIQEKIAKLEGRS